MGEMDHLLPPKPIGESDERNRQALEVNVLALTVIESVQDSFRSGAPSASRLEQCITDLEMAIRCMSNVSVSVLENQAITEVRAVCGCVQALFNLIRSHRTVPVVTVKALTDMLDSELTKALSVIRSVRTYFMSPLLDRWSVIDQNRCSKS